MRKNRLFLLILFGVIACKKNDTPAPASQINPVGTYSLIGTTTGTATYDKSAFSCLTNNKFTLNTDGTFHANYIGTDTCYVVKSSSYKQSIGTPGQPETAGTYTQKDNTIYFKSQYGESIGIVSQKNGVTEIDESGLIGNIKYVNVFTK